MLVVGGGGGGDGRETLIPFNLFSCLFSIIVQAHSYGHTS